MCVRVWNTRTRIGQMQRNRQQTASCVGVCMQRVRCVCRSIVYVDVCVCVGVHKWIGMLAHASQATHPQTRIHRHLCFGGKRLRLHTGLDLLSRKLLDLSRILIFRLH